MLNNRSRPRSTQAAQASAHAADAAATDTRTPLRIGLLRHGEVEGGNRFRGHTNDALTATGLQQMYTATDNSRWDRVISSPLIRCAAFANIFASQHALPLSFDSRLKEMHFGIWEDRAAADLMIETPSALTRFWNDPDKYPPPDGEPLAQFQRRVLDAWNDMVVEHAGKRLLVITHGGVIRVLLCHILTWPLAQLQSFDVHHGQLHEVSIDGEGKAMITPKPSVHI